MNTSNEKVHKGLLKKHLKKMKKKNCNTETQIKNLIKKRKTVIGQISIFESDINTLPEQPANNK